MRIFSLWGLALFLTTGLMVGCGDSGEDFVFTQTGTLMVPVARNDSLVALGNATLNQAAPNGVLNNDAVNGAVISAFDAQSAQGGTVVLRADGSFSYTPVFGFTGADSFSYTLSNREGSSSATVVLNVNGSGWFVNNTVTNGNGAQASPFNNLASAVAAAQNGDTIFVFRGDGSNLNPGGTINLRAGVRLIGEGAGLVLAQTVVPQGNSPTITGPVVIAGNNTVSGFIIDGSGTDAVQANDVSGLSFTNNTVRNTRFAHMDLVNLGGTVAISNNVFEPTTGDESFIDILNTDTTGDYTIVGNSFSDQGANDPSEGIRLSLSGASVAQATIGNNTFTSDNATMNSFDDAIKVEVFQTSQATVTVENNSFTNVGESALDIRTLNSGTLMGTVSGNTIATTSAEGIRAFANGGPITLTVTNNNLTGAGTDGILMSTGNIAVTLKAALRNNTITGSGGDAISLDSGNNSTICGDLTGNTVDRDMLFDASGASTINVERLNAATGGPLDSVNTFTAGMTRILGGGTVTPQNAGFCAIP